MKIVLDTNVLVSGLLSPFGAPGDIVRLAASGLLKICYDARILAEYQSVLERPKFKFDQVQVDYLLTQIKAAGLLTSGRSLKTKLPDRADEPFLEAAMASKARVLVTGNIKHFPRAKRADVKVLSPREFLEYFNKQSQ